MNAFFQIGIICPYKSIPEVPGIFGKDIVCNIKAERAQIFDKENRLVLVLPSPKT